MDKRLLIINVIVGLAVSVLLFPGGAVAVLLGAVCSALAIVIFSRYSEEKNILINVFLLALLVRVLLGTAIYSFGWEIFFAPDAITYDIRGSRLVEIWSGLASANDELGKVVTSTNGPGWGMHYLVGAMYAVFGRNMFAVQILVCVLGAATAPVIYLCSNKIFHNQRVSKTVALIVALSPSMVLWSCQMIKDGFIIFLLATIMLALLHLLEKFSYVFLIILVLSLFGVMALRFYIFYMVAIAAVGSFVVGSSNSSQSIFRRLVVIVLMGLGTTYLGVLNKASVEFEKYGNLDAVQATRHGLATQSAVGKVNSGFGEDLDVSTTEGAISAIPIGLSYLLLAPFPWQITNFRQAITLPEMLLWWASIPLLIMGLWYTIKHRLRAAIGILLFTFMLTIGYSIFQGNVGTAYRQRAQILVFLYIFISVGWSLLQEKRENQVYLKKLNQQKLKKRLQVEV